MNAELFKPSEIFSAYVDCRRRKRGTSNALSFEKHQVDNLVLLTHDLSAGRYYPRRYVCFMIDNPKPREIFAADFYDRVVHHLIIRNIEPYWEKIFIYDSFACRKEKGTLAAVERLEHFMRSITENGMQRAHFLQLDIKNFFMTIDKNILFAILDRGLRKHKNLSLNRLSFIPEKSEYSEIRNLLKILVFHDPTEDFVKKVSGCSVERLDTEKSLFNTKKGCGIPIGNLTSQFFANVYLNELDHFIKHILKARYYLRYVDDFIILHENPEQLKKWHKEINKFLKDKLNLTLKNIVIIKPLSCGINFLGYVQHVHYRLVRRRVIGNFERKLNEYSVKDLAKPLNYDELNQLKAVVTSYLAHCSKANSFKIILKTLKKHQWLKKYFHIKKWKAEIRKEIKDKYWNEKNIMLYAGG